MRTFPFTLSPAAAELGLAYLITIYQPNATLRVTTANENISLGSPDVTWLAQAAVNITQIQFAADGSATNADVRVASNAAGPITPGMGARGLLDGLRIDVQLFDLGHPSHGVYDLIPGATIGSVSEDSNGIIVFAVQGRLSLLRAPMCEVHTVMCRARLGDSRCRIPLAVGDVARGTAYHLKDTVSSFIVGPWNTWVRKLESGSYHDIVYECTTAGTTHATVAPTYPTTIGLTVTDGTAVFTARQAYLNAVTGQALDFFNIQLTADPSWHVAVGGEYALGNIIPKTGDLKNTRIPIKAYDSGTFIVTTWQPFAPSNFPAATSFEIHPGCDRLMATCIGTFANIRNFRGVPYAPNSDLQTGRA